MLYLAVIKLADNTYLYFGPFQDYTVANDFAQVKFTEYVDGKCAYVEGLISPVLFPNRKV
jgi:hypothetical protein